MVVHTFHDMASQYFPAIMLFDKDRYLGGYGFVVSITSGYKSERMLVDKFFNDLWILFFVIRRSYIAISLLQGIT